MHIRERSLSNAKKRFPFLMTFLIFLINKIYDKTQNKIYRSTHHPHSLHKLSRYHYSRSHIAQQSCQVGVLRRDPGNCAHLPSSIRETCSARTSSPESACQCTRQFPHESCLAEPTNTRIDQARHSAFHTSASSASHWSRHLPGATSRNTP